MAKAIVVFSGGQDSTTCLFWALAQEHQVHAVTFDYNQRHRREIEAARTIVKLAGSQVTHEVIRVGPILKGTSPLISSSELEQYADHQSLPGGIEKTFVPMRNQLFLTIAFNRAAVLKANMVVTGVAQEDYGGYPDCRKNFIEDLQITSNEGLGISRDDANYIQIHTPLMNLNKKATVELALTLPGCYEALAFSHTSYDGSYPPTGRDHATLLREKGFEEAGVPDPLVIRAYQEGVMALPITANYSHDPNLLAECYARVHRTVERVRAQEFGSLLRDLT
jgi:7-cyano-7-deazaguanine synthase